MVTFVAIPAIATKTSRKSVNASITLEPELEPMPDELESESDFDEDDTQDDVIQLETIATTEFSKFNATAESAPTVEHGYQTDDVPLLDAAIVESNRPMDNGSVQGLNHILVDVPLLEAFSPASSVEREIRTSCNFTISHGTSDGYNNCIANDTFALIESDIHVFDDVIIEILDKDEVLLETTSPVSPTESGHCMDRRPHGNLNEPAEAADSTNTPTFVAASNLSAGYSDGCNMSSDPQKPDSNEFGLPRSRDANSFDDNTSCIDSNVMELLDGEFFEMLDNCSASSNDNEGFGETSVPAVIDVAGELCEFHDSCYSFPRHSEWQRDSQSSSDDQRSEKNCTSDWENKAPLATMDLSADEFVDTTLNTSTSFAPEPDGVYDKFDEGYIERDIHNDNNDTDVDDVACMSENPNVESRLNTANIALTQEKLPVQLTVGQINIPRLDEIARFATYHTLDADCVSKKILVINRIDEGWIEIARFAFRPNAIAARVAENRRQHLAIGHIQPVSRHEYTLY
ncbi:hypothetical protein BBO99_00002585 [Phytophthora kernoviae]|uniref:Uncharacterized protein n=1 Tax=Phytophthora kernoviae TaxID=325452 RepID=A0A3R7NJY4_9STRA|nr:hypothetical protein JM16_007437 [Phytophthora kernoviae]RLN20936.1 hypothetical protein BBI17_002484 [Phytophthora kernoviae]RLN82884.1 hypothetical protein BBO99_00002585 [Phytophthora kernoviae]